MLSSALVSPSSASFVLLLGDPNLRGVQFISSVCTPLSAFFEVFCMWYSSNHPATWDALQVFFSDSLSLFSAALSAMMSNPFLLTILSSLALVAAIYILYALFGSGKKF